MDKAQVSRIVARLRDRGWLFIQASPENARRLRLSLTRSGAAKLEQLESAAREQIDGLLAPVDVGGRVRLQRAIGDMRGVLEQRERHHADGHAG